MPEAKVAAGRYRSPVPRQGTVGPLRVVLRDRAARRLTFAFTLFNGAEYATWLALMIYAFDEGGATAAGIVAFVVLVPAGFVDPVAGVLAERRRADTVLAAGYLVQGLALGGAAFAVAVDGPPPAVYALLLLAAFAIGTSRPAQALLTPALARDAEELTALNVVTEWSAQAAIFLAPAVAAGLFALEGPGTVFAVFAVAMVAAAGLVPRCAGRPIRATEALVRGAWSEVADGIRVATGERSVRLVLGLSAAGYVVVGALDIVNVALAIDHFGGTATGAAWLTAALGAGGVIGAALGGLLVGRRLAPALIGGSLLFGGALALLSVAPDLPTACLLLVVAGVGQAVVAIAGHTLLQRCAPTESVGRVFALREGLLSFGLALGSVVAPFLIDGWSIEGAAVIVGAFVPLVVLLRLGPLRRLDEGATIPVVELTLLRRLPIFAFLPAPAVEGLARNARWVDFDAGADLMRQGDPGDRFLAIATGTVDIVCDGALIAQRHEGEGVGETALVRQIPRTATVRARTPVRTLALGAEDFVVAVTGHDGTRQVAEDIADGHLESLGRAEPPPEPAGGAVSPS